jgi:hypothetical protein
MEMEETSPPSTSKELEEIRARQERLRDNVDDLAQKLAEKDKPWHKSTSTLLSIAGTVFAILSGLYTIYSSHVEDRGKSVNQLMSTMSDIVQLEQDEGIDEAQRQGGDTQYRMRSSLRRVKRNALLEEANNTVRTMPGVTPSSILNWLADEVAEDGNYTETHEYLLRAAKNAPPSTAEAVDIQLNLAKFCLMVGKSLCKEGEGKAAYLKAIALQPGNSEDTLYHRGQLLTQIGLLLQQTHADDAQGRLYWSQAEAADSQIATPQMKDDLAKYIAGARTWLALTPGQPHDGSAGASTKVTGAPAGMVTLSDTPSTTAMAPDAKPFLGRWSIIFSNTPGRTGNATFVALPSYPYCIATLEIYQDGELVEKQAGQIFVVNKSTAELDWTSTRMMGPAAGYTRFSFLPSGALKALQYQLNTPPMRFDLRR